MTDANPNPGDEPKKNSLKLLLRSKPFAEVDTSVGRVYLYPLRVRDMTDFGNLESGNAVTQIRTFLSSIASLNVESDEAPERMPLDPQIAKTLSEDEVEQLAEAYVQSSGWQTVREEGQDDKLNLPLFDVPLSRSIMRPSPAVPLPSFSQTALG